MTDPGSPRTVFPVPFPRQTLITEVIVDGVDITEEQRERVSAWLKANGIAPAVVARRGISIRYPRGGDGIITFTQYVVGEDGHKCLDPLTRNAAVFERNVPMTVPLPPEPEQPADVAGHDFSHPDFQDPVRCSRCGTDYEFPGAPNGVCQPVGKEATSRG